MICCTFAGHREVCHRNIEILTELAIESILEKDTAFTFYTGGMGDFDGICSSAVRRAKRRHPELDIKLIIVFPYMTNKINNDREYYEMLYDEIIIPSELSEVHYKSAIMKRNRWMVDKSDCLIAYVYKNSGGAYTTLKYARRTEKEIINLADSLKL